MVLHQTTEVLPTRVARNDLWLGVEHIRTTGNLGTLLRSAAAFGATGIMVFGSDLDRSDVFDPQCVRASMGALFQLRIVPTNHRDFRKWPRRHELYVAGADPCASLDARKLSFRRPIILMLGSERQGLSQAQQATCDGFVRIPMRQGVDSLNVAMAGTALLYEAFSQRNPTRRR